LVAVVAAAVVGVVAYLLIDGGDDGGDDGDKQVNAASDAEQVRELAAQEDHPVYWAGSQGAETLEWTELPSGEIYVRYLTGGAEPEDPRPLFLTVGTYPVGDGIAAIERAAEEPGGETFDVEGGGTGFVNESTPTSVYFAYPGSEYQIEVFHPDPERARELVQSGEIKPVL
jgi:hypothetical protein